jgi:tRNA 2-selenouridine synthase
MPIRFTSLTQIASEGFDTVIDVRTPSEFAEDHIPGAINLPVLSDAERARVGTIYVQESPFLARKIGAALVARNAALHIEGPLRDRDGGWRPLIYCWRGGQRSGSFASILTQIGWRAETVSGGYQSYRRLVVSCLYDIDLPAPVLLLDGNTGTAKTEILKRLPLHGVQILDLEGLANHRGSVLGGQGAQPSQKAFETALAQAISVLDPARPVVIEAESSRIGNLNLPPRLFAAMRAARRLEIVAPVPARAAFLARAYGDLSADCVALEARLDRLVRLQGRERVDAWKALAKSGAFAELAEDLIVQHYDPRYRKGRVRVEAEQVRRFEAKCLDSRDIDRLSGEIAAVVSQHRAGDRATL